MGYEKKSFYVKMEIILDVNPIFWQEGALEQHVIGIADDACIG